MLARIDATLQWAVAGTEAAGGHKAEASPISWHRLSYAETHILHKARLYLLHMTDKEHRAELRRLTASGLQCNARQQQQQEAIMQGISMDICSEVEWYKLAQLSAPGLRTAVDVGGNKGYLASLFVSLWGGQGYGVTPRGVFDTAQATHMWEGSRNPAGFCKDGLNDGNPLYCPAQNRSPIGRCNERNEGFTVRSFDGSSYLAGEINNMLATAHKADADVASGHVWRYKHSAVSDVQGSTRFTKQSKGGGTTHGPGFEGGKLQGSDASLVETEEVPLVTIDSFLGKEAAALHMRYPSYVDSSSSDGLTDNISYHVDLIKIDAEGNDNKVITGARRAIDNTVSLFTFEGGKGITFSKEFIEELDTEHGYSCYSTSRAGLFKWNGGCMAERYAPPDLSVSASLSLPLCLCLSVSATLSLPLCLCHSVSATLAPALCLHVCVCLSVCLSV